LKFEISILKGAKSSHFLKALLQLLFISAAGSDLYRDGFPEQQFSENRLPQFCQHCKR
jgi:hypothetical protein